LKKAAFSFISQQLLSKKDKEEFQQVFNSLDDDNNGCLTKDEFIKGHHLFFGESLPLEEVE
jgi:Ca2+-binding EF-hand superfamily protein